MLPKPKQYAAAATQTRKFISQPLDETRFVFQNAENAAGLRPGVCRVCLAVDVRMFDMSEHKLSDMYEQLVSVQINTKDKLPRQLCWECVGRLSSANRFIQKALKSRWILTKKIMNSRLITKSDIESIDKAQHKLESTLGTKFNAVNEYDFMFTDEAVESNNGCNIHTSKSAYNDCNEDINYIELNHNVEEQIFITEEFTSEIDTIKTEEVVLGFKEEANYTIAYKGADKDDEEGEADTKNVYISNEEQAISIKKEITSDEEVSDYDESVSEMSQEIRQVVDKLNEVCKEAHSNYTPAYKGEDIDDEEGYADTENVNIRIKQESTNNDEEVSGYHESVSEMSQEGRQVVNKSSELCEEAHNNYTPTYRGAGIDNEVGYTDTENVNIEIKQESTNDEEMSGYDESVSEMSQGERQVVDKSSEVCEGIKRRNKGSKNSLSPLRNQRSKLSPGYKELELLEVSGFTINNTEHSVPLTAHEDQPTTHITKKIKNGKPIKNRIIFEDDLDMAMKFSSDGVDTVKLPQSFMSSSGNTSHNINTNASQDINMSILSGTEYQQGIFICDICDKSFYNKPALILHVKEHPKMHYCTHCNYKTHRKANLLPHVNTKHTKSQVFNCAHCSYKAYRKCLIVRHVNVKHMKSEVFICTVCNYKTYDKSTLFKHVNAKHTKSEVFNCAHCSYKTYTKFDLLRHFNAKHAKSEVFNCTHCSYKAYRKSILLRHVDAKHTKNEDLNCTFCSYKTYATSKLLLHVNSKHTKSVFNCPHCSYKAYRKSDLLRHVNAKHTKSVFFNCPHCDYKASRKAHLLRHVNAKHTKSVFFNCPHCDYKASRKAHLLRHVNAKHTKSEIFNCQNCSYKAYTKSVLSKHVNAKHTKINVFNCSYCNYKSYQKWYLVKHVNAKHTKR